MKQILDILKYMAYFFIGILILSLFVSCEYPEIEIGQYDVELARTFIWEQGAYHPVSGYNRLQVDTIKIGPTCLIGCYDLDSATSYSLIPHHQQFRDTVFIDTVWTWTYTVPK